jgi:DegV family protein with EDD domain
MPMTPTLFDTALQAGYDRLAAWSDLLDAINVFPVADGDTGRNLQVSLTPIKAHDFQTDPGRLTTALLRAARGNSGNIAAQFFSAFVQAPTASMAQAARRGARAAYQAVGTPQQGTMLTVFDHLAEQLEGRDPVAQTDAVEPLLETLATTVRNSRDTLSLLKAAGVVDAGALGVYLFFEGFFYRLIDRIEACQPPTRRFAEGLAIRENFKAQYEAGYCVDTVLEAGPDVDGLVARLVDSSESVVTLTQGGVVKLHFHTDDREAARRTLEDAGSLVSWTEDDLGRQVEAFKQRPPCRGVHIVTDGAASLTRADQARYGLTLLDSYITIGDQSLPETRFVAEDLYRRMRAGERAATSQASDYERHQHYQRLRECFPQTLYLCVGSAFTGNYETATAWQNANDPDNRLHVVDTGAASGRLAVMVLAAARQARRGADLATLLALVERSLTACREYIFVDRLKYLAAGGRLSRPSAFMGDLLQVKPVISPLPTGAEKVGSVKNRPEQLSFAQERLSADLAGAERPLILLAYSDNRDWVEARAAEKLQRRFPRAEIILQPLSLTTGVHTGPGTWAVAVHPDPEGRRARTDPPPQGPVKGERTSLEGNRG